MPVEIGEFKGRMYGRCSNMANGEFSDVYTAAYDAPKEKPQKQGKDGKMYTPLSMGVTDASGTAISFSVTGMFAKTFREAGGKKGSKFKFFKAGKSLLCQMVDVGNGTAPTANNSSFKIDVDMAPAFTELEKKLIEAFSGIVKSKTRTDEEILAKLSEQLKNNGGDISHAKAVLEACKKAN
jgi:hypothetical protein